MQIKLRSSAIRDLIEDTIKIGVIGGYRRAHKYFENPTEEIISDCIINYVMDSLEETFIFPGENNELDV
jgi:hypothetical protein